MFLVGRLIGVCSLLTSMQNLGSKPVFGIGPARWPGSPSPSGTAQGFGEVVGGVNKVVSEKKIGGNGVEEMFSKDMTKDEMTLEASKMS